jgi:hypothetical protein
MKTGRTIVQLAEEIERQNKVKKDYLVDTRTLQMEVQDEKPVLAFENRGDTWNRYFLMNDIAHRQIGTHLGIPAKYYDKMKDTLPELLAENVNRWFNHEPSTRMIRTLDGNVRAFLSDRYRRIDNFEIASAVLPIIGQMQEATVESCEITETRMYLKVVNRRLQTEVVPGDIVQAGIMITNSEVGFSSVSVQPLVYRLVCSNGMVVNDAAMKRYHVGRGNEAGENFELFSNETLQADDRAFMMKVQDTVRAAVDETQFRRVVDMMREAKDAQITGHDIPTVVELTSRAPNLTNNENDGVLAHLIRNGDLSLYGLANAVTEHSQEVKSYDRATELESIGFDIMTMSRALWNRINREA